MGDYFDRFYGGYNTCEWCGANLGNYTVHADCPEEKEGRRKHAIGVKGQQGQDAAAQHERWNFMEERRIMMDLAKSYTDGVDAVLSRSSAAPWTYVIRGRNGSHWGVCEHCLALEEVASSNEFPESHSECQRPPGTPKWIWSKPGQSVFVCHSCGESYGPNHRYTFGSDLCYRCAPF